MDPRPGAAFAETDFKSATEKFMEIVDLRRSVRAYTPTKVSEEDLKMILESARWAPSGENAQPWKFIVVKEEKNKEFLSMISKRGSGRRFTGEFLSKQMQKRFETLQDEEKRKAAFKKLTSGEVSAFVSQSDVIVIITGRKEVWDLPFDTSAAIEHILLAVTAAGLGACWLVAPCIDIRDEKKLNEYFGIPEDYKTISIISIGEPAGRYPNARPRNKLSDIVYSEKYGDAYYKEEAE
ncbi:MAG: nitroreductase family protein [Peptococcaceae bacterium]|jgi:nitroreductase|nr:nitroreductase family protein [Peptococcaceae bacterium]